MMRMAKKLDCGFEPPLPPRTRKSERVALNAEIVMRRAGFNNYLVTVHDLSLKGCKVSFVDRPNLDEKVWVKIEGIEALEGVVCWVKGTEAGVEFERSIHPAVFKMLAERLRSISSENNRLS